MSSNSRHTPYIAARLLALCISAICGATADITTNPTAPVYTAAGIVQAASLSGTLAPFSIATIYGANLSYTTRAIGPGDLDAKVPPTSLDGVTVYLNGYACALTYLSPTQVNFIVPYDVTATSALVDLVRDGLAGPEVRVPIATGAPGLFVWNANFVVAEHPDGSLISPDSPAHPGDYVVLFGTGLGRTSPDLTSGAVPVAAMPIRYLSQLQILLDGVACDPASIYYAGLTPGYFGLYQINLKLPLSVNANPQIQVTMGAQVSPLSVHLYVQ